MPEKQVTRPTDAVKSENRYHTPNSDPMPRDWTEVAIKECSGAEFKVLYVIGRKTLGFQKPTDYISISQIQHITGLHRGTVIECLRSLENRGWISSRRLNPEKENSRKVYWLPLGRTVGNYFSKIVFKWSDNPPIWQNDWSDNPTTRSENPTIIISKVVGSSDIQEKEEEKLIQEKCVVSQQGGNGKSQSFLNFVRYEINWGRGTAISLQMSHGLPPNDDLLTYWQENGYKELLDFYNGNTAG